MLGDYSGSNSGTTARTCATFHTSSGSNEVCEDPSSSSCPSFSTTLWENPTTVDLVIDGTDALLVDKVVLNKEGSEIKAWWNDDGGAACFSSDPDDACWSFSGSARRGVSLKLSGSCGSMQEDENVVAEL